jgi:O-acetyl-ADP-ribose deacetylase (regulator of RNase III)
VDKPTIQPALLTEEQAAVYLGVSAIFLRKDRHGKRTVPFTTIGARIVRYPVSALQRLIESNLVSGGAS